MSRQSAAASTPTIGMMTESTTSEMRSRQAATAISLARQICRGWCGGSEAVERKSERMDTAYSPRLHEEDFGCRRTHLWDLAGKDPKDSDDFDWELRDSSNFSASG